MRKRRLKLFGAEARNWMDARRAENEALKPKKRKEPTMRVRELQELLDKKHPGAWNVQRNQTGFSAVRIDAVELISVTELASLAVALRGFQVYATMEMKTKYIEDGMYFALWIMPHKAPRKRRARSRAR